MDDRDLLDELLAADPLDMAEKISKKDSHNDEKTVGLGMLIALNVNKHKRKLLKEFNDTYYGMEIGEFSAILIMNGFEKVLTIPFMGRGYEDEPVQEYLYFFWNKKKSILVKFDTFVNQVNSSTAYFNWLVYEGQEPNRYSLRINGGGTGHSRFLGTSVDTREGFIRTLERMEIVGEFLKKWETNPFLWLLHYMDTKNPGYDYKAINAERKAQLSEGIQEAMGPNER